MATVTAPQTRSYSPMNFGEVRLDQATTSSGPKLSVGNKEIELPADPSEARKVAHQIKAACEEVVTRSILQEFGQYLSEGGWSES